MFSTQLTTQKKNATIILELCLKKTRARKPHDYHDVTVFKIKVRFLKRFCPHENANLVFSVSSGLETLRVTDQCGR